MKAKQRRRLFWSILFLNTTCMFCVLQQKNDLQFDTNTAVLTDEPMEAVSLTKSISCELSDLVQTDTEMPATEENVEISTEVQTEVVTENETAAEVLSKVSTEAFLESETEVQSLYDDIEFQDRCRIAYAESGVESSKGQIAVVAVILNREESNILPDSFYGVIQQKWQFSSVKDGEIYNCGEVVDYENIPQRTINAVERALSGEDPTEKLLWEEAERLGYDPEKYAKGGALFFYNPDYCSDAALEERARIKVKVRIGDHIFFKVW